LGTAPMQPAACSGRVSVKASALRSIAVVNEHIIANGQFEIAKRLDECLAL
jgi:hypothetical protein